jgi:two-component system sensor histidine kinase KdpD
MGPETSRIREDWRTGRQDPVKTTTLTRTVLGLGLVLLAASGARLFDADLTSATLIVLIAVLLAARFGLTPGLVSAVGGFLLLNYWFTSPRYSLAIDSVDNTIALVVFLVAAALIVTRLDHLRRTAQRRELEAGVRLDLTNRALAGETPAAVAQRAVDALVPLFGLAACSFRVGTQEVAFGEIDPGSAGAFTAETGGVKITAIPRAHSLSSEDRAVLEALLTGLATAIDRVRLEEKARSAEVAAEVDRTRTGFLTAVTHNLRTPLASIRAASSTLLAPDLRLDEDDRRELLDTIYSESDRLERQVAKILAVSRIRSGGLEPQRVSVDLVESAQIALRRLRPLESGHTMSLDIADEVPDLFLDPTMVDQVLLNLLENALAYAPAGTPIEITARRAGGVVEMRVVDHGPGVDRADRDRIFEEFVRASARPEAEGTGLGLAIVRAVVELHGGKVAVEDTSGGGATFVVSWPVAHRRPVT